MNVLSMVVWCIADACGSQEVYAGDSRPAMVIEDTKTCFETINNILRCAITLEQEHKHYQRQLEKQAILGSQ